MEKRNNLLIKRGVQKMELQDVGKLLEMLQRVSPEKQEKILIFAQGVAAGVSAANAARDEDEKKKPA